MFLFVSLVSSGIIGEFFRRFNRIRLLIKRSYFFCSLAEERAGGSQNDP